ncbi:MAG: sensor histidine kinase [Alistipes sp.]|nr:sensor histidine kinase [Alistipes sp.]
MMTFLKYLRQYRRTALFFLIFSAIFYFLLMLYGCAAEAVFYAAGICAFIGLCGIICGFFRFRRRSRELKKIFDDLPVMSDELPSADSPAEETLYRIISRLHEISGEKIDEINSIRKNSEDYFTVWIHQIKTPISAMQMILQNEDTDTCRELSAELFRIEQYAEMALHYIRLDSGSNDLVLQEYDLDDILKQAIHRYAPLFIRKRIQLKYKSANAAVLTDKKWLGFVVEQLLSNAVKYTVNGGVTISFENNILTVRDTGIGISPDDLPRIFEKGYTGLSGRSDRKSTGLGLYLCKKVCDKLGHRIYAESEVNSGTAIHLDLSRRKLDIE